MIGARQIESNLYNIRGGGGGLVTKSHPTLVISWTVARQAPLSMGFSRQEYWSRFPCPPPGDLPSSGIKPRSPSLQADFILSELLGKLKNTGVGISYPFSRGSSQPRN